MSGINSSPVMENCNNTILLHLLLSINSYYGYKNLVIITNNDYSNTSEFNCIIKETEENLQIPVPIVIFTESKSARLNTWLNKDSLSLIFLMDSDFEVDLNMTHTILLRFRTNKSIFVVKNKESEFSLQKLVKWMWMEQFINSIILWNYKVYGFDPFPDLRITTPEIGEYFQYFRETHSYNLKGYFLHTPARLSIPRLFIVKDENGKEMLTGVNGYLFMNFLKFMNMTWEGFDKEFWWNVSNNTGLNHFKWMGLYSIDKMSAEVAAEAPLIISSSYKFDYSYPTDAVDLCLMLPVQNALASHLYILRPFSKNLWMLLILFIFYATIAMYILLNLTYFKDKYFDFFICFQQTFNIISNSSNVLFFSLPSSSWIILFLPLFIMGFTMYSFYTTYLAAFLTTIIFEADVVTMEQLLQSDIKVMAVDWQIEALLKHYNMENITRKNFISIKIEAEEDLVKERNKLNTSYGYMVPSDMWNIYAKEQELLRRPIFKLSEICYTKFYVSFPIKQDSYIGQPLKYLIMRSQQFGLLKAWDNRSFRDAIREGTFHLLKDYTLNDFDALSPSFLTIAFWILLGGYIVSGITFVVEVLIKGYLDKTYSPFPRRKRLQIKC